MSGGGGASFFGGCFAGGAQQRFFPFFFFGHWVYVCASQDRGKHNLSRRPLQKRPKVCRSVGWGGGTQCTARSMRPRKRAVKVSGGEGGEENSIHCRRSPAHSIPLGQCHGRREEEGILGRERRGVPTLLRSPFQSRFRLSQRRSLASHSRFYWRAFWQ